MEKLSMCRICLAENVRMYSLINTNLQEMYEMLTAMPFETKDSRPQHVCCICRERLQNCHQLRNTCLQSEELLTQMIQNNRVSPMLQGRDTSKVKWINISIEPDSEPALDASNDDKGAGISYDNVKMDPIELSVEVQVKEEHIDDAPVVKNVKGVELEANSHNFDSSKLNTEVRFENKLEESNLTNKNTVDNNLKKCGECDKFFTKKNLIRHTRVHTGDKPYKCFVCDKCFSRKSHLVTHIRLHTGDKPYKCEICEKTFRQKSDLNTHNRVHTGEKPHKCIICEKYFRRKCHLITHTRVHTGEKPYECNTCHRRFSQTNDLTQHIRVHTGEKPFKCDICHNSFTKKTSLNIHYRLHTGEKPYKCDTCETCFSRKSHLINHIRKHTTGRGRKSLMEIILARKLVGKCKQTKP